MKYMMGEISFLKYIIIEMTTSTGKMAEIWRVVKEYADKKRKEKGDDEFIASFYY